MYSIVGTGHDLSMRIQEIRIECFGRDNEGVATLAKTLGIPALTWANYEAGVTMTAEIMLKLIEATGADPGWLLRGKGERYSSIRAAEPTCDAVR